MTRDDIRRRIIEDARRRSVQGLADFYRDCPTPARAMLLKRLWLREDQRQWERGERRHEAQMTMLRRELRQWKRKVRGDA